MRKFVSLLSFFSLLGICLGAGGSIGGGSTSTGDLGSVTETENTRLFRDGISLMLTCDYNYTNIGSTWRKNGTELEENHHYHMFSNTSLYIPSLNRDDIGEFSCLIHGHTEEKYFYVVDLLLHKHLPKSTTVLENDKLKLTCQIEGTPIPSVQWLKDGEPLDNEENSTRLVFEENTHHVPNASLLIKPILKSDFGSYVCLITIHSLHLNTTTEVRVKDIYAALWPFLGIVAEVTILCAIIFIYEKRRIKPNLDRADMDEINEQKNATEQNKETEIRQRK
ncbi:hypothetical protein SK128_008206 [Halocaridina rubra]|uniref:Ig-like domain-containing protein n=1 Tax=Halocaridina rubra TaxID=373956 RepID=A0AAN9A4E9_HALRR